VKLVTKVEAESENISIKNAISDKYKLWPNGVIPFSVSQVVNFEKFFRIE